MRELSNDELSKLSNEELRILFLEVRARINKSRKKREKSVRDEIYFCYISREMTRRQTQPK